MLKERLSEEENFLTKLVGNSGENKKSSDEEEDIDDLSDLGDESDDLNSDDSSDEEDDSDEKKNQRLESKIDGLNNKIDANVTLTRLLADPDVRAVLEAKKNSKKDNREQGTEEEETQEDYDKMSNKDLVQSIVKKFGTVLQGVVEEKLAPLSQKLSAVEGSIGNDQQEKAKKAVLKARRRFSDFDRFVPEMKEILKDNPGLSVNELYYLSKLRKSGDDRRVESERPKNHISRGKKQKVDYTGNSGFSNLVDAALDRVF